MKIYNYNIKVIPLNPFIVKEEFPINFKMAFAIKGDFTFTVFCAIQYYLWCEDRVPKINELANKFNVSINEIEKNVIALHKQNKLIFYVKE